MATYTILVTGASRGLGAATARIAGQMRANVALMARSANDLASVAEQIEAAGGEALPVVGDVSKPADCERVVIEAVRRFGQIDAVVNNAGVLGPMAPIAEADPEAWETNWAINVLGPIVMSRSALPHLRSRGGRVLNVSSGAAINVIPGWGAYCVAKAALNHFTRVLAVEEPDVTSLSFRPGVVDTDMQATIRSSGAGWMPEEVYDRFVRYYTEGELLPPEVPACSLVALALYAPHQWSGDFLAWNDERVLSLVRRFGTASCKNS
jgi:NAD(P)-dependent dehydrogenase (short-subunit alcohol dehydrogenase family)